MHLMGSGSLISVPNRFETAEAFRCHTPPVTHANFTGGATMASAGLASEQSRFVSITYRPEQCAGQDDSP